jgi:hypothetical protein
MKIGDLVRARHWYRGEIGVVMEINPRCFIVRVKIITPDGIWEIDQLGTDLEVINENR